MGEKQFRLQLITVPAGPTFELVSTIPVNANVSPFGPKTAPRHYEAGSKAAELYDYFPIYWNSYDYNRNPKPCETARPIHERNHLSDSNVKPGVKFCRQYGKCLADSSNRADVATLVGTHMHAAQNGDFHKARATLNSIPRQFGLRVCEDYDSGQVMCTSTVEIAWRINKLKTPVADCATILPKIEGEKNAR